MNRHPVVFALAAVAVLSAACGSDDSDDSSSTSPGSASTESTVSTDSTASTESTGGQAADGLGNDPVSFSDENVYKVDVDRTGETIRLGVTNDEGSSFTTPEMRAGMLTAIDYINANGGVNGAMIEPVVCVTDATPEGTINCANQFVEEGVDIVTYGTAIHMDAALKIYEDADIAIVAEQAYNQTPSDHAWATGAPPGAFNMYSLMAMKDLGVKKAAFLPIDVPVFHYHGDIFPKWGAKIGIDTVVGPYVDASNADWSSAVQSVLADGADGLVYFGPANGAVSIVAAARQFGFDGPILTTDISYASAADESAMTNNYLMFPRFVSEAAAAGAPPSIQENVGAYVDAMTAAGHEDLIEGYAEQQFAATIEVGSILETIPEGPINFETISAALSEDRNLIGWDGPDFNCGNPPWPQNPSFCRAYQVVLKIEKDGDQITMTPIKSENGGFYYDNELAAQSTSL